MIEKGRLAYNYVFSCIRDILRGQLVFQNVADMSRGVVNLIALVRSGRTDFTIVRIKNRYEATVTTGYRDIQLVIRLSGSGILAEIQLHTVPFLECKVSQSGNCYCVINCVE